jgi:hypothetical protein
MFQRTNPVSGEEARVHIRCSKMGKQSAVLSQYIKGLYIKINKPEGLK